MKIAIVGAGIVGVTTAYELARDGHAVTVFERRASAAEESSFANAGLLAPGLLRPWAAPGALGPARAPLLGRQALVRIASGATRADLAWLWRWRRNALQTSKGVLPPALAALEQLARYSHRRLHQTLETLQLDPETRRGGLVLLRSEAEHAALAPVLQLLRDAGVALHELDAEAARAIEPGLCPQTPLACALHLPGGELGNCRLFALMLRQAAQALGVEFMFGTTVRQLHTAPAGVELAGDTRPQRFDAIVLCAGGASAELLRPLGLRLPLAQLHGYTVSTPLRDELHAPLASVVDASQRISITRLGQRIRVAGGAELGHCATHHQPTLERMYQVLTGWFPGGAQLSAGAQVWRGSRAMLPDGLPVLGLSGQPGLWLNIGHGDSGWALASGCARVLSDLMAQRTPEVDHGALTMGRW